MDYEIRASYIIGFAIIGIAVILAILVVLGLVITKRKKTNPKRLKLEKKHANTTPKKSDRP